MRSQTSAALRSETPQYELRSGLAQYCLPSSDQDEARRLAWANSICAIFLVAAFIDLQKPELTFRSPTPPAESIAALLPPASDPPPANEEAILEAPTPEPFNVMEDLPVLTPVVVAQPEQVSFAVPIEGFVVVSTNARFIPPPPSVLVQAPPPAVAVPEFKAIRFGDKGFRKQPPPSFPLELKRTGGTIEVQFGVNSNGIPDRVEVSRGSGITAVDREVCDFIRREWRAFPGQAAKYRIAITFQPW